MKQRILIVADDVSLRATLARWLMAAGYSVELADAAKRARELAGAGMTLAILAPERVDGADVLARELADRVGRVILITGAADGSAGKFVSAAPAGRLSTPLKEADVLACVDTALSAAANKENGPARGPASGPECLRFEGYTLDIAGCSCLDAAGAAVALTRAEFSLLLALASQPGRVLSRDELRQAMVGRDAGPDDRSVDVLISRLRRKIERDPKAPRMIVTVPGAGYKFGVKAKVSASADQVAASRNDVAPSPPAALPVSGAVESGSGQPEDTVLPPSGVLLVAEAGEADLEGEATGGVTVMAGSRAVSRTERWTIPPRSALIGSAAAMFVGIASLLIAVWYAGVGPKNAPAALPRPRFDAAVIPLVNDTVRKGLASYAERPDFKALAIAAATGGWGVSFGALDEESAKREALQRCSVRSTPRVCRIYAVGMDVVWSPASLPLPIPADIHTEALDIPLVAADIPTLTDATRQGVVEKYVNHANHKALAIKRDGFYFNNANNPDTARRLAVERCADVHQVPCLLLSVDGMLTVQIPRSRPVTDIFLLTTEREMSEQDKERIGQVYREKEWRALARGGSGKWYPVANAASEADAVDAALNACAERDHGCLLHAIGNFRVAADDGRGEP